MKRKIVLAVALAAGLVAALLTRMYLAAKDAEVSRAKSALLRRYGSMEVLCFKRDTPAGTVLSRDDINVQTVPAMGMRGQALTEESRTLIVGKRTLIGHKANEIIFWADIEGGDPSARGLSDSVKKTWRAVSVNVSGAAAVSGMVKPNDHVDVIGTFNFPDESGSTRNGELVTCTILQNVLVLATGRDTANSMSRNLGGSQGYSMVTLQVTPREAEILAFAEQMKGRLMLSLRNRNDTSTEHELPNVDFKKIRSELEELNFKREKGMR